MVLGDVVEDLPQGKALDMLESSPIIGSDASITGSNGYQESANSDVVVITAGIARGPGMSRDDLLLTNMKIHRGGDPESSQVFSRNASLSRLPIHSMPWCRTSLRPAASPETECSAWLEFWDTARFRTFIAQEMQVSVEDVQAYVSGRPRRRHGALGPSRHSRWHTHRRDDG